MKTNQTTEKKLKKVLRGEIYYADLPAESCGAELRGMHPVLIVQNDVGNRFSTTTIVLPITTDRRTKKPMPTPVYIGCLEHESIVLAEQMRVIDKARLRSWLASIDDKTQEQVDRAIKISLAV